MAEPQCPLDIVVCGRGSTKLSAARQQSLGIFRHTANGHVVVDDPRVVPVRLAGIESHSSYEYWTTDRPFNTATGEGIRYSEDGVLLFGWIAIAETHLGDLEEATSRAYAAILRLLQRHRYPYWLRAWNYLSDITEGTGDKERYRRFTVGRHRALSRAPNFERLLPAATTLGTCPNSGLRIAFLASRVPGFQIENPRQTSAFTYPRVYGPKSPSFSRAVLQHWSDRSLLYVSGTASIVGHATQHPGDAPAQFEETLRNIEALLRHTARQHFSQFNENRFQPVAFKLYVRNSEALRAIGTRRRAQLTARVPTIVLYAELCRRDLLVEVEGVFQWGP